MDNQHRKITGYRELSQAEIDLMNRIKAEGVVLEALINELRADRDPRRLDSGLRDDVPDQRWVSIAQTHFQEGLMALTRAVAKPTSF